MASVFREQDIELRCQLCKSGGASACERCSRPVCSEHHGPDRCKVCEDGFESAQAERDAEVEHLRKLVKNKRHRAPDRVRRYNNLTGLVAFAALVLPIVVALIVWPSSVKGLFCVAAGFASFFTIWAIGPLRFRLNNGRERQRQAFLAERKSAALHRDSGWRVELADATRTPGSVVEDKWKLYDRDRIRYYTNDAAEVFVLKGDQRAATWDQVQSECVLVTGSLIVDGPLDLRMKEPGGFLAVLGDLEARSADIWSAEGVSSLYVGGTVKLDGCLVLCGGGTLVVDGDLDCKVLVSLDDHAVTIGGTRSGELVESCQPATELFDADVLDEYGEIDEERIASGALSARELGAAMRILLTLCLLWTCACASSSQPKKTELPKPAIWGEFQDDYGIRYQIDEEGWHQLPDAIYRVHKWNHEGMYLIAQNDEDNPSEPGLWTRIDWVFLDAASEYSWAFCLTTYNAQSAEEAEAATADREQPRSGCNGFPFSRMR